MKQVKLLPGAPPLDKLHGVLRIDIPVGFDPKNWEGASNRDTYHGKVPADLNDEASELVAGLEEQSVDIFMMLGNENITETVVLVDDLGQVWSYVVDTEEKASEASKSE